MSHVCAKWQYRSKFQKLRGKLSIRRGKGEGSSINKLPNSRDGGRSENLGGASKVRSFYEYS